MGDFDWKSECERSADRRHYWGKSEKEHISSYLSEWVLDRSEFLKTTAHFMIQKKIFKSSVG